jgi:hypothetical protein
LTTIVLAVGLGFSLFLLLFSGPPIHLPGNQQEYEPLQPIRYSHRLHAGELSIPCLYCHFGAERSRNAGIPPASICMNCHKFVTAKVADVRAEEETATKEGRPARQIISPEIQKLYDAVGFSPARPAETAKAQTPIVWTRVHNLPSFVQFDHRPHINSGVACQSCHGPVETMERVKQVSDLGMGWCVNCHRESTRNGVDGRPVKATLDCVACHY